MKFTLDTEIDDLPDEFTLEELGIRLAFNTYYPDLDEPGEIYATQILIDVFINDEEYFVALVPASIDYKLQDNVVLDYENDETTSFINMFGDERGRGGNEHPVLIEIERAAIELAQEYFDGIWTKKYIREVTRMKERERKKLEKQYRDYQ